MSTVRRRHPASANVPDGNGTSVSASQEVGEDVHGKISDVRYGIRLSPTACRLQGCPSKRPNSKICSDSIKIKFL